MVILTLLLSIVVSLNFFWSKPLVPGFDTPFYLTEIRSFSKMIPNPLTYPYLDRYLTIAFPGLLTKVFNFDPVTSYRIAITLVYAAISYFLYRLFRHLTGDTWAAVSFSGSLVISPFFLTYSTMLFANFTGFLILFIFLSLKMGKDYKYKNVLLGVILGLIFYTHNFSSVVFCLIIVFYYLFKLIFTGNLKIIGEAALVFIIAALIGSPTISRYVKYSPSISKPSAVVQTATPASSAIAIVPPAQLISIGGDSKLILDTFREYTGKYWLYFMALFLPASLYLVRKQLWENRKLFILPLAIFIPSFILSLQPLYHLSYLPERFVTLVSLSLYFFYVAIIMLPPFKKYIFSLAVLPLFLNYIYSDSLILNKGYRSFSRAEIKVYEDIKPLIKTGGTLFISSDHYYWSKYFLANYYVIPGEHFISCGNITTPGYYGETNFTFARLLAEDDSQKALLLVRKLRSYITEGNIYILVDTDLGCGKGLVLQKISQVRQLFNQNSWYLYEII